MSPGAAAGDVVRDTDGQSKRGHVDGLGTACADHLSFFLLFFAAASRAQI